MDSKNQFEWESIQNRGDMCLSQTHETSKLLFYLSQLQVIVPVHWLAVIMGEAVVQQSSQVSSYPQGIVGKQMLGSTSTWSWSTWHQGNVIIIKERKAVLFLTRGDKKWQQHKGTGVGSWWNQYSAWTCLFCHGDGLCQSGESDPKLLPSYLAPHSSLLLHSDSKTLESLKNISVSCRCRAGQTHALAVFAKKENRTLSAISWHCVQFIVF